MRAALVGLTLVACGRIDFGLLAQTGDANHIDAPSGIREIQVSAPTSVGSAASAETTFAAPVAPGDSIVAFAWIWGGSGATLPPTGATVDATPLDQVVTIESSLCNGQGAAAIYAAVDVDVSSTTVTVTPAGGGNYEIGLVAVEYGGISAFDTGTMLATPASGSPKTYTTGTLTTQVPGELLASIANECSGFPGDVAWTDDDPAFVVRNEEISTQVREPGYAADQIADAAGAYDNQWTVTFTGESAVSIAAIAAFR